MNFFILDGFLAVGSLGPNNVKAEVYDFGMGDWTTVQDYPYSSRGFGYYDMVYFPATSAYYVIGGFDEGWGIGGNWIRRDQARIGMFKNGAWSEAGQLKTARYVSFRSFLFQSK